MAAGGIEHTPVITEVVNAILGGPAAYLLDLFGLAYNPHEPIPTHVLVSGIIIGVLLGFASIVRRHLREVPEHWTQHIAEIFMAQIHGMVDDMIGHKGRQFQAIVSTLALYLLFSNLIGLLPFFAAPTASPNTTVALALVVFLYYNWHGIRTQGIVHYLRHFAGPRLPSWLIPVNVLIFFIEMISNFARILSLSMRLFGNIFGGDMVVIVLLVLAPYFIPGLFPIIVFSIVHGSLQAFVFVMLTIMYIASAVETEEH